MGNFLCDDLTQAQVCRFFKALRHVCDNRIWADNPAKRFRRFPHGKRGYGENGKLGIRAVRHIVGQLNGKIDRDAR